MGRVIRRAIHRGPSGHRIGESHPRAVISDDQVREVIRRREEDGLGYRRLAAETGIPISTIRDWCTCKTRS